MTAVVERVVAEPVLVPRRQAAEMLGLGLTEFDELRRAGRIFVRKYGRKVLVPMEEIRKCAETIPWDEDKDS